MVNNKTYNNLIDTLEQLGVNHYQIQQVSSGDIFEMDLEKNTLYPLMHIVPQTVVASQGQFTFNFQVFIMDLVEPDESNEQEVLSDCLSICTDIIATFKHGESLFKFNAEHGEEERYFVDNDFTIEPFTERFDNAVSGWTFTIPIIVEQDFNSCNIPQPTTSIGK